MDGVERCANDMKSLGRIENNQIDLYSICDEALMTARMYACCLVNWIVLIFSHVLILLSPSLFFYFILISVDNSVKPTIANKKIKNKFKK